MERRVTLDTLEIRCRGRLMASISSTSQDYADPFFCRFFRRGWVTFDRSVNIKEICWNLQNIRVSAEWALSCTQPRIPLFFDSPVEPPISSTQSAHVKNMLLSLGWAGLWGCYCE